MSISIRAAEPADAAALKTLARRTISAVYRPFLGDESVDHFISSGMSDRAVVDQLPHTTVIANGSQIVGFSVVKDNLIDLMMIDRDQRRQGYGSLLLAAAEQTIFTQFADAKLESFADNEAANSFYRQHGWQDGPTFLDTTSGIRKIVLKKQRDTVRKPFAKP